MFQTFKSIVLDQIGLAIAMFLTLMMALICYVTLGVSGFYHFTIVGAATVFALRGRHPFWMALAFSMNLPLVVAFSILLEARAAFLV